MQQIRSEKRIHVRGTDLDDPMQDFNELNERFGVKKYLINNIQNLGYSEPSAIQMQAIPSMIKGKELLACAPTGSGKTASFLIPIISFLKEPAKEGFRAVIVSPTRELSEQIYRECLKLVEGKRFRVVHLPRPLL